MMMKSAIAMMMLVAATCTAVALPTFPEDWSAGESDTMIIHQGQYGQEGGEYCCPAGSNCEVQYQSQIGTNYFAYTLNATRFDGQDAKPIINLFGDVNKEVEVDANNMTCVAYCPIQGGLFPFSLQGTNATYKGQATVNGQETEWFQWNQTAFGVIVMEVIDFYASQPSGSATAVPVQQIQHLTPFGQPMGQQTNKWANFKAGTPAKSLFQVVGLDSCPQAQNCGNNASPARAQSRLRNGLNDMFRFYQTNQ